MSRQITVRLPDVQVDFLDTEVDAGRSTSRAAAISQALRREQRRRRAEQDLRAVLDAGDDSDLIALQDWAANRSYPELDYRPPPWTRADRAGSRARQSLQVRATKPTAQRC